jgi:class 3 adenylate cyclase
MSLADDLAAEVGQILRDQWQVTTGRTVPSPESIGLGNFAVEFDSATVLYADIDGSTAMVDTKRWQFSAEVYKTYLRCAAKIIKANDGVITAYDGDRVMAVFLGDRKNTNAVIAALKVNSAVHDIINPAIKSQYGVDTFVLKHVIGVDTSSLRAARTGVRGDNDLVWVGRAANYAAKLTSISGVATTWITADVFDRLHPEAKQSAGRDMWERRQWTQMNNLPVYCSAWKWTVG